MMSMCVCLSGGEQAWGWWLEERGGVHLSRRPRVSQLPADAEHGQSAPRSRPVLLRLPLRQATPQRGQETQTQAEGDSQGMFGLFGSSKASFYAF